MAPMRPVDASAVIEGRETARYLRGLALALGMAGIDGVVWWLTSVDVMFGLLVAVATWQAMRHTRYGGARRVLRAVALIMLVLAAGVVTSTFFPIGLPPQVRLVQGAGGIALGLAVWWGYRSRARV